MSDFSVYQDAEQERLATTSQRMMRALHPDANRQARLSAARLGLEIRRVRSQASTGFIFEVYFQGQLILSEKAWGGTDHCHLACLPARDRKATKLLLLQTPLREGGRGQISVYRLNGQSVLHYPLQQKCKQLGLDDDGISVFFDNGDAIRLRCHMI